jgi:hypothetical protein
VRAALSGAGREETGEERENRRSGGKPRTHTLRGRHKRDEAAANRCGHPAVRQPEKTSVGGFYILRMWIFHKL